MVVSRLSRRARWRARLRQFLQVRDAVFDAYPAAGVFTALGLAQFGDAGHALEGLGVVAQRRGDHLPPGLRAEALVAGVGEDLHPAGVGQPVGQPALAGLVMSAVLPRTVAPQNSSRPWASVTIRAKPRVGARLAGDELLPTGPLGGGPTDSDLGGVHQRRRPHTVEVADHVGQARSRSPASMRQPRSASNGRTSLTARVIVKRSTPNQAASTSGMTPWRRQARVASSRSTKTNR
jgi:hypothetical protein